MRHVRRLAFLSVLLCAGCALGPSAMKSERTKYNIAVQQSANEQLLLNLVRLKYREPTCFLQIGSIAASLSYSSGLGIGASLPEGTADTYAPRGEVAYAERPTISFTPLQGEEFAKRLMAETDMNTFTLLFRGGWSIEFLMRLLVERVGRLHNHPLGGPASDGQTSYERFLSLAREWRTLQKRGDLTFVMMPTQESVLWDAVPPEQVNPTTLMAADRDGYRLQPGKGGKFVLSKAGRRVLAVRAVYDDEKEADRVEALLGVKPARTFTKDGRIVSAVRFVRFTDPESGEGEEGTLPAIPLQLRSVSDVLFFLAQGLEVPPRHEERGFVRTYKHGSSRVVQMRQHTSDLLNVKCRYFAPSQAFVAVRYRGHWFYIDDADVDSKDTFAALTILFALQAGDVRAAQPVLTIPVSSQ